MLCFLKGDWQETSLPFCFLHKVSHGLERSANWEALSTTLIWLKRIKETGFLIVIWSACRGDTDIGDRKHFWYCFGNSVTASTKSNSCLLVSLFYSCRCICRTKCTNVFRTMIHRAMNTWETVTFITPAPLWGEREEDLLKLFDVSVPDPWSGPWVDHHLWAPLFPV